MHDGLSGKGRDIRNVYNNRNAGASNKNEANLRLLFNYPTCKHWIEVPNALLNNMLVISIWQENLEALDTNNDGEVSLKEFAGPNDMLIS